MLWLAVVLIVMAPVSFMAGFVLFANGAGVAPHRRTSQDPTGVKRAASRVAWSDVFRGMPSCVRVYLNESSTRSERLAAAGSFLVLVAVVLGCLAALALVVALI